MAIISWYTLIGLIAQLAFAARMLVQWIMSERARAVVNPALFWWLSLLGSLTMSFYGYLREDLAILLGQLVSFYVYVYNLKLKGQLQKLGLLGALAIIAAPLIMLLLELRDGAAFAAIFLNDEAIPYGWLAFGMAGQFLFTFRFIYQLVVSHRQQQSLLPPSFWYISLLAALMVQVYGIYRLDIVLILGQVGGLITYVRNIMLHRQSLKTKAATAAPAVTLTTNTDSTRTSATAPQALAEEPAETQLSQMESDKPEGRQL